MRPMRGRALARATGRVRRLARHARHRVFGDTGPDDAKRRRCRSALRREVFHRRTAGRRRRGTGVSSLGPRPRHYGCAQGSERWRGERRCSGIGTPADSGAAGRPQHHPQERRPHPRHRSGGRRQLHHDAVREGRRPVLASQPDRPAADSAGARTGAANRGRSHRGTRRRHRAPRPQAGQHPRRRGGPCGHRRLRHRPHGQRHDLDDDRRRGDQGHRGLHGAGAGAGHPGRCAHGCLFVRPRALRDAVGTAADRRHRQPAGADSADQAATGAGALAERPDSDRARRDRLALSRARSGQPLSADERPGCGARLARRPRLRAACAARA